MSSEVEQRFKELQSELQATIDHSSARAALNHWTNVVLLLFTILSSVAGGIGGIFCGLSPRQTGGLAIIPGFLALTASTMRFQEKAQWHYRMKYGVQRIKRRLTYELSSPPGVEDIHAVSRDWSEFIDQMQRDWPSLSFSWISTQKPTSDSQDSRKTS